MTGKRILVGAVTALCVAVAILVGIRVAGIGSDASARAGAAPAVSAHVASAGAASAGAASAGRSAPGGAVPVAAGDALDTGDRDPAGRVHAPGNGRPSPAALWVDGCDHNYADAAGEKNVCVPKVAPAGRVVDCAFLRSVGFGPLKVVGVDSRQLAGNGRTAPRGATVCAG